MNTGKTNSATTTNRYCPSARCDGVSAASVSGSRSAATSGVSSCWRRKAQPQISAPTPAIRMTTQASDQRIFSGVGRSEDTSELQSLMRISYAVFCLKKKKNKETHQDAAHTNKH